MPRYISARNSGIGGQGAGEGGLVLGDDAAPDADGVEFGMLLRAGLPLLGHDPEIQLPDLVPAQVDALVSEEVRGGAEDLLHAVLGQDPDQGAVGVERDRSDVHTCILPERARCQPAPDPGAQAALSSRLACLTSRPL
jgi:hypothetical protein